MPRSIPIAGLSIAAWLVAAALSWAQAPVEYRLSFADYVRHVVDVDVVFSDVTADPLEIHMSRSSPGRYALHEFAKNVFELQISDGTGRPLSPARPNLHVWSVTDHGGTVRVRYRLFDATVVIRRSVIYTGLAGLITGAYALLLAGTNALLAQTDLTRSPWFSAAFMFVVVVGMLPGIVSVLLVLVRVLVIGVVMLLDRRLLAEHDVTHLQHRLGTIGLVGKLQAAAVFRNYSRVERGLLVAAHGR